MCHYSFIFKACDGALASIKFTVFLKDADFLIFNNTSPHQYPTSTLESDLKWKSHRPYPLSRVTLISSVHKFVLGYFLAQSWLFSRICSFRVSEHWTPFTIWALQVGCSTGLWQRWRITASWQLHIWFLSNFWQFIRIFSFHNMFFVNFLTTSNKMLDGSVIMAHAALLSLLWKTFYVFNFACQSQSNLFFWPILPKEKTLPIIYLLSWYGVLISLGRILPHYTNAHPLTSLNPISILVYTAWSWKLCIR